MEVRVNNMTMLGFQENEIEKAKKFAKSTSNWVKSHRSVSKDYTMTHDAMEKESDNFELEL